MNARSSLRHVAAVASLLLVSACLYVKNDEVNKVTGPVGGSVTGSEVLGEDHDLAVLGHLLSRVNGDNIADALNDEDLTLMTALALSVLDHGADDHADTWRNRHSRHHGSFVAMTTWSTSDRIMCRRFTNTIYIDQSESRSNGTACRQRDGTWAIMG